MGKALRPGFRLAVEDVGMFAALLPSLVKRLRCFAMVRNPLAIRASASSIRPRTKPRKNPPALVGYESGMDRRLNTEEGVDYSLPKMHLIFERYRRELPREHILRYEDTVGSGGGGLGVIMPAARELDEPLRSKNTNPLYDRDKVLRFGESPRGGSARWSY